MGPVNLDLPPAPPVVGRTHLQVGLEGSQRIARLGVTDTPISASTRSSDVLRSHPSCLALLQCGLKVHNYLKATGAASDLCLHAVRSIAMACSCSATKSLYRLERNHLSTPVPAVLHALTIYSTVHFDAALTIH